jgi:predicted metal-dependent hydrolase
LSPARPPHPKLRAALSRLQATPADDVCQQPPPSELLKGVHEFNEGKFFEQHETLELLWRATPGVERHLYEGILLVGVGFYHLLERRNFHGATVKLEHGIALLNALPATCQGVDVARLRLEAGRALRELVRLGPDGIDRFQARHVPRIRLAGDGEVRP